MAHSSTLSNTVYMIGVAGTRQLARKSLRTGVLLYLFTAPDRAESFVLACGGRKVDDKLCDARGSELEIRETNLRSWACRGLVWALLDESLCNVQSAASDATGILPEGERAYEDARVAQKLFELSLEFQTPIAALRLQDKVRPASQLPALPVVKRDAKEVAAAAVTSEYACPHCGDPTRFCDCEYSPAIGRRAA